MPVDSNPAWVMSFTRRLIQVLESTLKHSWASLGRLILMQRPSLWLSNGSECVGCFEDPGRTTDHAQDPATDTNSRPFGC